MPLTRSFKETVQERVQHDPIFRTALLEEAIDSMLEGDTETSKTILRDYINATVGFEALSVETGTPAKSLMRMFSPHGNPSMRNLFAVLKQLQQDAGILLKVEAEVR